MAVDASPLEGGEATKVGRGPLGCVLLLSGGLINLAQGRAVPKRAFG